MHFGIAMFATEYAIGPGALASEIEQRGFESIWFPEHTHIPASRRTPWPGGGELPLLLLFSRPSPSAKRWKIWSAPGRRGRFSTCPLMGGIKSCLFSTDMFR
jgi:hypothetical protein